MRSNNIVKGLAIGFVAGAVATFVVTPKSREVKRTAGKFMRTCGDVVDTVSGLLH